MTFDLRPEKTNVKVPSRISKYQGPERGTRVSRSMDIKIPIPLGCSEIGEGKADKGGEEGGGKIKTL